MLLDDIIELATDNRQSLPVLLRKCVVLGYQLRNDRLKSWANKELNGYDAEDELPPYRVLSTIAKGNFSGPMNSQLQHWEIAPTLLEERHREWATTSHLIHSISAYEHLSSSKDGDISSPWDPNLVLYYQSRLSNRGYILTSAWQEIPTGGLVGMLDTIRNRVLNMALELKAEIGHTDEDLQQITPDEASKVDQTIVNVIYGGNIYMSTGQSTMTAITGHQQVISVGDSQHLERVLRAVGIAAPDLGELSEAVTKDGKTLGKSVMAWITKNAGKVLSGGIKIGTAVGQAMLVEYLKQYLGIN